MNELDRKAGIRLYVFVSQVLQCDVAHAIKDMAKTLRRIDRRLAKDSRFKL